MLVSPSRSSRDPLLVSPWDLSTVLERPTLATPPPLYDGRRLHLIYFVTIVRHLQTDMPAKSAKLLNSLVTGQLHDTQLLLSGPSYEPGAMNLLQTYEKMSSR